MALCSGRRAWATAWVAGIGVLLTWGSFSETSSLTQQCLFLVSGRLPETGYLKQVFLRGSDFTVWMSAGRIVYFTRLEAAVASQGRHAYQICLYAIFMLNNWNFIIRDLFCSIFILWDILVTCVDPLVSRCMLHRNFFQEKVRAEKSHTFRVGNARHPWRV